MAKMYDFINIESIRGLSVEGNCVTPITSRCLVDASVEVSVTSETKSPNSHSLTLIILSFLNYLKQRSFYI
tara:strand:+ start:1093 stop:1305 length:213 start_codon:yes stop_codon:yes gene_type:complete